MSTNETFQVEIKPDEPVNEPVQQIEDEGETDW
jgi:hypothetical protein